MSVPNFIEEATLALKEQIPAITRVVLTKQVPAESQNILSYLNAQDSSYAFFAPSFISIPIAVEGSIPGLNKKVTVISNSKETRLFGFGLARKGTRRNNPTPRMQFFRMDFIGDKHFGPDNRNHDIWYNSTGVFQFHVPKNI
jgi:hypothetical protein